MQDFINTSAVAYGILGGASVRFDTAYLIQIMMETARG